MRKPLILLVDDDRAVLDALEAALAPTFEPIARIETFASGQAVLVAVQGWTDEKRPIAVAIVDQKMPGITGVDLLIRVRAEAAADPAHPAAHMRAILLTGYAGLDSAIAAKNEAGVELYVEKPWTAAKLAGAAASLFDRHLEESSRAHWFEFREVTSRDDVEAHLRLRYEVYRREPKTAVFLPPGARGLDVDAYDAMAHFLTLYASGEGAAVPIGTLRVVRDVTGPAAVILDELVAGDPVLQARLRAPRPERLPLMNYLVDGDAVRRIVAAIDAAGESVAEPSRLTLDPHFRSAFGGRGNVTLAYFLIEGATAFFFFFRHCLLTCVPQHVRFYRPLGFREAEGTHTQLQPYLGVEASCLHGIDDNVPSPARERVISMATRIRRTGSICLCPTFPACLPEAYEPGRFEGVDLFCPIEARAPVPGRFGFRTLRPCPAGADGRGADCSGGVHPPVP